MGSKEKLLALINADNPRPLSPLTFADVTFSPAVIATGGPKNTKVKVSAIPGSGYKGSVNVYYDRLDMSVLGPFSFTSETPFTFEEILQMVNEATGQDFVLDDIAEIDCSWMEIGDISLTRLEATDQSLEWMGQTELNLLYGLPGNTDVLHYLLNHTLATDSYLTP